MEYITFTIFYKDFKTYKKIIVHFNKLKWKRINNKIKNIQLKYKIKSSVNRLKKMEKIQKMAKYF